VVKSGLSEVQRGGRMRCWAINMAGLAAVPALPVGPARNIFSKRWRGDERGGYRTAIQNGRPPTSWPSSPDFFRFG